MDSRTKARILSDILSQKILPLIEQDYVLYGLPYYSNIGDTLIWEGELSLLRKSRFNCKAVCGWDDYPNRRLPEDVCILIQGGGYFGDVWRYAWENVLNEISVNSDRRIILLPMSVWYNDKDLLEKDVQVLSRARKLTILVRDQQSFDFATRCFNNEVRLVPDMAFAISPDSLSKWTIPVKKDSLYLKRNDKEFLESGAIISPLAEIDDWPTFSSASALEKMVYKIESYYKRLHQVPAVSSIFKSLTDQAYYHVYRNRMISRGVEFLSQYHTIYTMRLHGMILASLLGKNTFFVDNSYGKVSSFYNTWLSDVDNINPAPYE